MPLRGYENAWEMLRSIDFQVFAATAYFIELAGGSVQRVQEALFNQGPCSTWIEVMIILQPSEATGQITFLTGRELLLFIEIAGA